MGNEKDSDLRIQKESALERFGLGAGDLEREMVSGRMGIRAARDRLYLPFRDHHWRKPAQTCHGRRQKVLGIIPFTMQMAMIIIGGYVVASTPAVYWIIRKVALIPKNGKTAVAWIAFFSMLTSLISWGLSLIFSGLLVREMTRRLDDMDYRAAGAAAYLGLGAVWALGLSSSAAMMMATKGAIPPRTL